MADLFFEILNMSISAGWVVLFVLAVRLLLKKAPGWVRVSLWSLASVRLVIPFSLESALSLLPSAQTVSPEIMLSPEPEINSGVPIINTVVNNVLQENFVPAPEASANPMQILGAVAAVIWVVGIVAMVGYMLVSYLRLRRLVGDAVPHSEGVFLSERVKTPFLLGFWKPKVYLPYFMEEEAIPHVLAHERAHMSRKDHWWKPLGFALLSIHWFNPLIWVAYTCLCRDIEAACDERAIRDLDGVGRADYAQTLLNCCVNAKRMAACPVSFGEVDVKRRIKAVLQYKKPKKIVVVLSVVVCIILCGCVMTNPKSDTLTERQKSNIERAHFVYEYGLRWDGNGDLYYGNYEGYEFFLISKKYTDGKYGVRVGGEVFQSKHAYFDIYGYQNGEFQTLSYLYGKHYVSDETVKTLAQINAGNIECPILSQKLKAEVEEKWIAPLLGMQDDHHWYWEIGGCEYYGTFEGYDILYYVPNGYPAVIDGITIGEYTFENGHPFGLYAYKNERLYSLKELYNTNRISEKTIKSLWEKHTGIRESAH